MPLVEVTHAHSAFHFDEATFCISSAFNILFLLLPSLQIFVCGCGALCSLFLPSVHMCMQMRSLYRKSKVFSHTSLYSVLPFLTSPLVFFISLKHPSVFLICTYEWHTAEPVFFITVVTARGERAWKEKKQKEFRNCVPLVHLFSRLFYSLYTVGPNPI